MKIAHLVHQFLPETHGGLEAYVADLAQAQLALGHEVLIISSSLEPRAEISAEPFQHEGLNCIRIHRSDLYFDSWDRMYAPKMTALVVEKVQDFGADIAHLHHWIRLGQDLGCQLHDAGIPFVVTLHDFATSCPRAFRMRPDETACFRPLSVTSCLDCVPRWPWLDDATTAAEIEVFRQSARAELSRARRIISASVAVETVIREGLSFDAPTFRVAPLGYQPRFSQAVARPVATETFRFGYWGSITHRKGLHLLVDAMRSLHENRPAEALLIELDVFGSFDLPERESSLKAAAEGLPIRFHGRFDYAELTEAGLSAAVFPSLCIETYGLVLDEAFELGLPVVVPNVGALADRAGAAGRRFAVNDAGALARAMGALVDDPQVYADQLAAIPAPGPDSHSHALVIDSIYREALDHPVPAAQLQPAVSVLTRHAQLQRHAELQFRKLLERGDG